MKLIQNKNKSEYYQNQIVTECNECFYLKDKLYSVLLPASTFSSFQHARFHVCLFNFNA